MSEIECPILRFRALLPERPIGVTAMISTATAGERLLIKPNIVEATSEAGNESQTPAPTTGDARIQRSRNIVTVSNKPDAGDDPPRTPRGAM